MAKDAVDPAVADVILAGASVEESREERDIRFMRAAIREAQVAMEDGEVPVGCVFVDRESGKVIGRGGNNTNRTRNGTRHCEMVAIDTVIELYGPTVLQRCRLYVTLEPCIMCAAALLQVGLAEVVFGAPNTRFGGCGGVFSVHEMTTAEPVSGDAPRAQLTGYTCRGGVLADEIVELLKDFYATGNPNAPDEKRHRPLIRDT